MGINRSNVISPNYHNRSWRGWAGSFEIDSLSETLPRTNLAILICINKASLMSDSPSTLYPQFGSPSHIPFELPLAIP